MGSPRIAEMTVDELRKLIREVTQQTVVEMLRDPDEGLELREEMAERLRSSLATTETIPAAEVAARQAMTDYEEERGKPMPSKNHGIVQSSLICALKDRRDEFTIISELSLELNDQPFVPDVSVFPKLPIDWHNDEIKLTDPPSWVIEILSPTQALDDLVKKADTYFAAGVQSCWIIQPALKLVVVLAPGRDPEFHSAGTAVDPATGIAVPVKEIFE